MNIKYLLFASLILITSCKDNFRPEGNTDVAKQFVDAFYSFNRDSLESVLALAKGSHPEILYYQKWAQCGNYEIVKRSAPVVQNDSLILCPVTVKDDLMGALRIDFNVTDTFHITIREGKIRSVTTSSNDPAEYYQAKEWVKNNRSELITKPCEGIWEGGPTPCECIQGMIKGFGELVASKDSLTRSQR